MLRLCLILALLAPAYAATSGTMSAADAGHAVAQIAIDPDECYRVIELNFSKEDLRIYFTSGYIAFAKPINGMRIGAVFATDVEAGDAEVLLLPPTRGERLSLADFTGSPNLEEHFKLGLMVFTDTTGADLLAALQSRAARKSPEMGALFASQWTPSLRNMTSSFSVRLVYDLLSANPKNGLFYMGVGGSKAGNFDVIYDPTAREQILLGQLAYRSERPYFDIWTSFPSRSARSAPPRPRSVFTLDNYRIDADIGADLKVKARARVQLKLQAPLGRAVALNISTQMTIQEATLDGQPTEVFQAESLRSTLIRASGNQQFLIVAPSDIDPAKPHELEFRYEGDVIEDLGNRVYRVGSRGNWYPRGGMEWSRYDLNFRCPKDLILSATGELVEEHTDGDWRFVHRRASSPIRFAGFNLGDYTCINRESDGYDIGVCANRSVEAALKRPPPVIYPPPVATGRRRPNPEGPRVDDVMSLPPLNPSSRLQTLADDVVGALEFMTRHFGPPPLRVLTVTPVPGGFGQGFPGLVYLATLSYLDPAQFPPAMRDPMVRTFYSDVLQAHEVAHQWWGNLVSSGSYQDDWMMEALADYSALMFLEKKKGPRAMEAVLDRYRTRLLGKTESGRTLESEGPITWGLRLLSSHAPEAWRTITYEKGAWIMHMLRHRLGDQRFSSFLGELVNQYRFRVVTIDQFRELAARFLPPKSPDPDLKIFFENWVYGTGIPSVKLSYSARGAKLSGTIKASDVDDDFTLYVPVEVQQGRQKTTRWLLATTEPTPFTVTGNKIAIAANDVLIRK